MQGGSVSSGDSVLNNAVVPQNIDTTALEEIMVQNTEAIVNLRSDVQGIYTVHLFSLGLLVSVAVCVLLYKFLKIFY